MFERECIVSKEIDCSKVNTCYQICCQTCDNKEDIRRPPDSQKVEIVAGRRRVKPVVQYIGQTGRSLHARASEHLKGMKRGDKQNPLSKHIRETHQNEIDKPEFIMRVISTHKTNLHRLISEGIHIEKGRELTPEGILNSKTEWGAGKQIRFTPATVKH